MNNQFILTVLNTLTGRRENVIVTEEVYHAYKRTGWAIDYNDERFFAHEVQFSSLKGGDDGSFENFDEFVSEDLNPLHILADKLERAELHTALSQLTDEERHLLIALYVEGMTEREYASQSMTPQKTLNDRKRRLLRKLKEILE